MNRPQPSHEHHEAPRPMTKEEEQTFRAGLVESPLLPHDETLATLAWMDEIRARLGVRYPFE